MENKKPVRDRKGFSTPKQRNKAQSNWRKKKSNISFSCEPEIKKKFDKERNARNMSQPEFLTFLLDIYM